MMGIEGQASMADHAAADAVSARCIGLFSIDILVVWFWM